MIKGFYYFRLCIVILTSYLVFLIKKGIINAIFFAGTFFYAVPVYSQDAVVDLYTRFYSIRDVGGLSEPQVNDLYQDYRGFVWVGTDEGLFRYDGHDFYGYFNVAGDSLSISSNVINTIAGDNQGGMWIGTDNGLNFYDRENDRFTRFIYDVRDPGSIRNNHVRKLFPERGGLLLVETLDGTLTIFDRTGKKTRHFSHDPIQQPYYRYHALYQENNGNIWFGGRSLGLHRIDPETGIVRKYPADPLRIDRKRENDISLVHVGSDGQWYVAGLDGFYRFFPESGDFERIFGTTSYYAVNDRKGNVWIGTGFGLVRYNNENGDLRYFRYNQDIPWSLAGNRVNVVMSDRDGNIWAGTDSGLSFLSFRNSRFSNYTSITGESGSLSSGNVTSLLEDKSGRLWVGTRDKGLNLWDENSGDFIRFDSGRGDLAADNVSVLYEDSRGDIWIGLWAGAGFNRFDPATGMFSHYAIDPNSMSRDWYNDFYEDARGKFWLGVWGANGLMGFDRETGGFSPESYSAAHIPRRYVITNAIVTGDYIFLTDNNGRRISRYSLNDKSFVSAVPAGTFLPVNRRDLLLTVLPAEIGRILFLEKAGDDNLIAATGNHLLRLNTNLDVMAVASTDTIISFCISEGKNLIYVLHDSGLSAYNGKLEKIAFYDLPVNFREGAKIVADKSGNVYLRQSDDLYSFRLATEDFLYIDIQDAEFKGLASLDGGVYYLSGKKIFRINDTEVIFVNELYGSDGNGKMYSGIKSVAPGVRDELILLFEDGAIRSVNVHSGNVNSVKMPKFSDEILSHLSFATPVEETLFLVASGSDIFLIDARTISKELINSPDSRSLTSHLVTAIMGEKDGTMWVGTSDGGLNRLYPGMDKVVHYMPGGDNGGLAGMHVTSLFFDADSNLWVGTRKGISVINRVSGKMEVVGDNWGVSIISSIIQDDDRVMWIGTGSGLIRFCPESGDWLLLNESDGLPSSVFNRAAVKRNNGTLVFGTREGIIVIDPSAFDDINKPLNVRISFFEVLGKRTRSNFNQHDTVFINHKSNYITIGYSTMSYHHPPLSSYYYRMDGLSDNWMESTANTANFTSLPPGTYLFRASMRRNGSSESGDSTLTVIVKPPFYQTIWFRLLFIAIIAGGMAAVFATYIHQLKLRHKSARFEQRLLLSQMNPHFVFNSLSAIQSFIFTNDASEASDYLSDFSRLMRLILQNSRSEEVPLSREIQAIKLYLRLQKLRFFDKFDYEIMIDPSIFMQQVMIPPMLIQPFIENSIEHGIMHKKDRGLIKLEIKMHDDHILAIVTDDGVGITRSADINAGRDSNHQSLGTSITNERLKNLYKRGGRKAGFEITDRYEGEGVEGTRVVLTIPYRRKSVDRANGINDVIFREDED